MHGYHTKWRMMDPLLLIIDKAADECDNRSLRISADPFVNVAGTGRESDLQSPVPLYIYIYKYPDTELQIISVQFCSVSVKTGKRKLWETHFLPGLLLWDLLALRRLHPPHRCRRLNAGCLVTVLGGYVMASQRKPWVCAFQLRLRKRQSVGCRRADLPPAFLASLNMGKEAIRLVFSNVLAAKFSFCLRPNTVLYITQHNRLFHSKKPFKLYWSKKNVYLEWTSVLWVIWINNRYQIKH